jgi:hypothetical protein
VSDEFSVTRNFQRDSDDPRAEAEYAHRMRRVREREAELTPAGSLEWLLSTEPELHEFVTPWGRVRALTASELHRVRRDAQAGRYRLRWAQWWWMTRESYLAQPWCWDRDDREWIASAYATVATAYAKQAAEARHG